MEVIAFIGGGNMARALIGGAVAAGVEPSSIHVAEPDDGRRQALVDDFGIRAFTNGPDAVATAGLVVLAVKPQVAAEVVSGLGGSVAADAAVVSVMAGVRLARLRRWLGPGPTLVRVMPNTPALIGAGIAACHAGPEVGDDARRAVDRLLSATGASVWVDDEGLMDAVTAVSGSGPAYVFLMMEALVDAGVAAGLDAETAHQLAAHTFAGASRMILESDATPSELRRQVTSPGGTTEAAVAVLESNGLRDTFRAAVAAAVARGRELAGEERG